MLKRSHFLALASLGLLFGYNSLVGADQTQGMSHESAAKSEEKIDVKKLSEALGNVLGTNLKSSGFPLDVNEVLRGMKEGFDGKPSPLTDKEFETMMMAVSEKAMKEKAETNLKAANEFMEKNKKEDGIKEIVPGKLDYKVLKEGTGALVEPSSSPQINYTGKYQDGTVFGSSEEMGGPITIPLDQTIPGFSKGIAGMKEGEKRRLFVHPDLGYGTSGQLPPNELLIFDVEVVKANSDEDKHQTADNDEPDAEDEESSDEESEDEDNSDEGSTEANKKAQPTKPAKA